jgi:hypothetical protein
MHELGLVLVCGPAQQYPAISTHTLVGPPESLLVTHRNSPDCQCHEDQLNLDLRPSALCYISPVITLPSSYAVLCRTKTKRVYKEKHICSNQCQQTFSFFMRVHFQSVLYNPQRSQTSIHRALRLSGIRECPRLIRCVCRNTQTGHFSTSCWLQAIMIYSS